MTVAGDPSRAADVFESEGVKPSHSQLALAKQGLQGRLCVGTGCWGEGNSAKATICKKDEARKATHGMNLQIVVPK